VRSRVCPLLVAATLAGGCGTGDRVTVCSKNFTESILLGEIVAQRLEAAAVPVDRRLNLGGTFVCHEALVAGQVDTYVEYTGTAYSAILKLPPERDPARVRAAVDSAYRARWNVVWTEPFGFENTFAILVRGADARRLHLTTVSDAVPYARDWRPGFGYEFVERADGYRGLVAAYGLTFANPPAEMDLGLLYRALADGQVDLIAGNSTDGQIAALDLARLADDRRYFPPYEAAPVIRAETLKRFPAARGALAALGGTIDEAAMRRMNYEVDVAKRPLPVVAREFLQKLKDRGVMGETTRNQEVKREK
jgi:glycine betaine/choline ABC-type transport system substrate-binding protein